MIQLLIKKQKFIYLKRFLRRGYFLNPSIYALICFILSSNITFSQRSFGLNSGEEKNFIYVVRNDVYKIEQTGFKVKDFDGIFTCLHGILQSVENPNDLLNFEMKAIKFGDKNTETYDLKLAKIYVKGDLAFFQFKNSQKKISLSEGLIFSNPSINVINEYFSSAKQVKLLYCVQDSKFRYSTSSISGLSQNSFRTISNIFLKDPDPVEFGKIEEFNRLFDKIFDQNNACDINTSGTIPGMSGSPILMTDKTPSIIGIYSIGLSNCKRPYNIAFHFTPDSLSHVTQYLNINFNHVNKLIHIYRQYRATLFCNNNVCKMYPPKLNRRKQYSDGSLSNETLTQKEKNDYRNKSKYRSLIPKAYKRHFSLQDFQKPIPFGSIIKNKNCLNDLLNGYSPSVKLVKALYGFYNASSDERIALPSMARDLAEYLSGIPIKQTNNENYKKVIKQLERDKLYWKKNGYNLDYEIRNFLLVYYKDTVCAAGYLTLLESFANKDYCESYVQGINLLTNLCDGVKDKQDSIQNIICESAGKLKEKAFKLKCCAEDQMQNSNFECALESLYAARELFNCLDDYSETEIIQSNIDEITNKIKSNQDELHNQKVKNFISKINILIQGVRKQNADKTNIMLAGVENNTISVKQDTISFKYFYGNVEENQYYLSAYYSGFSAGEYRYGSEIALDGLSKLINGIFLIGTKDSVIDKSKTKIGITGFADGLNYTGNFKYRNEFDNYNIRETSVPFFKKWQNISRNFEVNESPFSLLVQNKAITTMDKEIDFDTPTGLGKNYALSYLRAVNAFDILKDTLNLKKDNFSLSAKIVDKIGGEYRRVEIETNFVLSKDSAIHISNNEVDCPCLSIFLKSE